MVFLSLLQMPTDLPCSVSLQPGPGDSGKVEYNCIPLCLLICLMLTTIQYKKHFVLFSCRLAVLTLRWKPTSPKKETTQMRKFRRSMYTHSHRYYILYRLSTPTIILMLGRLISEDVGSLPVFLSGVCQGHQKESIMMYYVAYCKSLWIESVC